MREIIFRAWDGKEMHRGVCVNQDQKAVKYGYRATDWVDDADAGILMQYTGLKDKNGVDIYEEDIVEYDGHQKAKVIFKGGAFLGYDGYATSSDEAYLVLEPEENPFDGTSFEIEVIGNIHENPELLK